MARKSLKDVTVTHSVTSATMGHLVSWTHPDRPLNATKVITEWTAAGLDPNDLPDVRTAADVFMAACRSVETPKRSSAREQVVVNRVKLTSEVVVYQLTRLVRDTSLEEITHEEAMTLRFTKSDEQITVVEMDNYASLQGLEDAVRAHYAKHPKDIPGPKIRNTVRELVERIGGQNIRRRAGGLYFVALTHRTLDAQNRAIDVDNQPTLDGLETFFERMWDDHGDFYAWPVMSREKDKQIVAKHFALNVNRDLRKQMEDAVQRVRKGKGAGVQDTLLTRLYNERRRLTGQIDTFDQLVTLERTEIDANLRDLDQALSNLQDLADS